MSLKFQQWLHDHFFKGSMQNAYASLESQGNPCLDSKDSNPLWVNSFKKICDSVFCKRLLNTAIMSK